MSIRQYIQDKLNEITDIVVSTDNNDTETYSFEVGTELPDDMLVLDTVYFSYLLTNNYIDEDFEHNSTRRISLIGYLKFKSSSSTDDLLVIDNAQKTLENKLKEINFKISFNDVSIIDNIRKIQVRAYATYNEINNGLI